MGTDTLPFIVVGTLAAVVLVVVFREFFKSKRLRAKLAARTPRSDEEFAREFFPTAGHRDIAVRARRVLATNLEMPLLGITPEDRLNEDLNAELAVNPHLFWELETEFKITTDVECSETHGQTLEQLVTFRNLVEYIERRMAVTSVEVADDKSSEEPSRAYNVAIRSLPFLFVGGFLTMIAGAVVDEAIMNAGGLIFIFGVVVWGLANGAEMLRGIIRDLRGCSWEQIRSHRWSLIIFCGLGLFFLWFATILGWAILKHVTALS